MKANKGTSQKTQRLITIGALIISSFFTWRQSCRRKLASRKSLQKAPR